MRFFFARNSFIVLQHTQPSFCQTHAWHKCLCYRSKNTMKPFFSLVLDISCKLSLLVVQDDQFEVLASKLSKWIAGVFVSHQKLFISLTIYIQDIAWNKSVLTKVKSISVSKRMYNHCFTMEIFCKLLAYFWILTYIHNIIYILWRSSSTT